MQYLPLNGLLFDSNIWGEHCQHNLFKLKLGLKRLLPLLHNYEIINFLLERLKDPLHLCTENVFVDMLLNCVYFFRLVDVTL